VVSINSGGYFKKAICLAFSILSAIPLKTVLNIPNLTLNTQDFLVYDKKFKLYKYSLLKSSK
jgi:hypothetical protein